MRVSLRRLESVSKLVHFACLCLHKLFLYAGTDVAENRTQGTAPMDTKD